MLQVILLQSDGEGSPAQLVLALRLVVFPLFIAASSNMLWQINTVNKTWLGFGDFIV